MEIVNSAVRALVALALLCWTSFVIAGDGQRFPTDGITRQQWQMYLDETLAKPRVRSYESAGQIIVEVPQESAIYVFTSPAHPAYPAVVKRQIGEKEGSILINRTGHYAGDKAAYQNWWRQFDALDDQIRGSLRK